MAPFPFIVSMPRSGSTLLRAMIDCHPDICVPWESHFIPELWTRRSRYERESGFDTERFVTDLLETPIRSWELDRAALVADLDGAGVSGYADAVRALYRHQAARHGKRRYGDKTPGYINEIPLLAGLFPEARFIHLVRDGRDVAVSLRNVAWGTSDIKEVAADWRFRVQEARKAGDLLGPERYLQVGYERLVADPVATLAEICEFTGLEFDPAMLDYPGRAAEIIAPDPFREHHTNLFRPPTAGLRDWRRDLTGDEVSTFEFIAGAELAALGYALTG